MICKNHFFHPEDSKAVNMQIKILLSALALISFFLNLYFIWALQGRYDQVRILRAAVEFWKKAFRFSVEIKNEIDEQQGSKKERV